MPRRKIRGTSVVTKSWQFKTVIVLENGNEEVYYLSNRNFEDEFGRYINENFVYSSLIERYEEKQNSKFASHHLSFWILTTTTRQDNDEAETLTVVYQKSHRHITPFAGKKLITDSEAKEIILKVQKEENILGISFI